MMQRQFIADDQTFGSESSWTFAKPPPPHPRLLLRCLASIRTCYVKRGVFIYVRKEMVINVWTNCWQKDLVCARGSSVWRLWMRTNTTMEGKAHRCRCRRQALCVLAIHMKDKQNNVLVQQSASIEQTIRMNYAAFTVMLFFFKSASILPYKS